MEIQEFSDGFTELLNSHEFIARLGEPYAKNEIVLDEYQKSLFLTKAEYDVVLNLYNGKNAYGESFESTEEIRRYLAPLVVDKTLEAITNSNGNPIGTYSKYYSLPTDPEVWFIIYESLSVTDSTCGDISMSILPVTHDEYHRIKDNPFRGPNKRRALRLDLTDDEGNVLVEIVCNRNYDSPVYHLRYLRKPAPIILVDLEGTGVSVEGETEKSEKCELHDALHQAILEKAVILALQHKARSTSSGDKD